MEDTQTKTITDEEIAEAWHRAEEAKEPDQTTREKIIKDPNLPDGVAMRYSSMESAGWVVVYHQKTGDKSIINRNWLPMQLKKKLEDGSPAFSIYPPKDKDGNIITPIQGTIKCRLHKDDPNRKHYDAMGFAVCPKDNISSPHSLIQHMRHRHKVEWEAMEKERIDAEKDEDRMFQRSLMTKLVGESKVETGLRPSEAFPFVCECGKGFTTNIALQGHKRSHK